MTASTRLTSAFVALGVSGIIIATSAPAQAQQAPSPEKKKLAKQYVDAGLAAQNAGDYDQAVALYQKAYDQIPHPLMLFNIGQAQRLAGRDEEALAAYQKYVDADPNGPKAQEARGFIAEIQPRVMKARAEAAERARMADESERKRKDAEQKAAEAERKRKEAEEAAAAATLRHDEEEADQPDPGRPRKKLGLILGGGGLVVAGVGTVFAVLARRSWNDAKAICDPDRVCASDADTMKANDLAATTRTRGNLASVLLGVGGATVAGGVVIYLSAPSRASTQQALRIVPSNDGGLVTWSGQW